MRGMILWHWHQKENSPPEANRSLSVTVILAAAPVMFSASAPAIAENPGVLRAENLKLEKKIEKLRRELRPLRTRHPTASRARTRPTRSPH